MSNGSGLSWNEKHPKDWNYHKTEEIKKLENTTFPLEKSTEITLELTNYCPHTYKFCSSDSVEDYQKANFMPINMVLHIIGDYHFTTIHLSGGEPLAHPQFWHILRMCKRQADDVIIHTNALTHIIFNANVIDNIYVEANLTVSPDVDKVHILKRAEQGREKKRPEVHFSGNCPRDCNCNQIVYKPDGSSSPSPCRKFIASDKK
jgi:hypothetical protein